MHPEELTDLAGPSTPRVLHWTASWRIGRPSFLPRGLATEQRSYRLLTQSVAGLLAAPAY